MVDTRFFTFAGPMPFSALCAAAGIVLAPDDSRGAVEIRGASEPATAQPGDIALIAKREYAADIGGGQASVYIVAHGLELALPAGSAALEVDAPHISFVRMLDTLYPAVNHSHLKVISEQGHVPKIDGEATIAATATIGPDVEIGDGSVIGPGVVLGRGVTIGRNCVIGPNVTIACAHLGDGIVIQAGAQIGADGFGWLDHARTNRKIPQLGRVLIQDRVDVGANTTIDRGALGDTVIGENTKIDNLVQIGHNCKIGRNCLIAAMTGLAGSTEVGDSVLMGGNAASAGHVKIGEGTIMYARAAVSKDWPAGSKLAGSPARDIKEFARELAAIRRLGKGKKT